MVQNDKKLFVVLDISGVYIIWLLFMVHMCKMIISPGMVFIFSKFWFFGLVGSKRTKKRSKMTKNSVCHAHSISQEPYIIWLSFMVHMCKIIISPDSFFIFSKFCFFGLLGGLKWKKWSKMTKHSAHDAPYLRNKTPFDCHLWSTCIKW